jgi:hypothetical protein
MLGDDVRKAFGLKFKGDNPGFEGGGLFFGITVAF